MRRGSNSVGCLASIVCEAFLVWFWFYKAETEHSGEATILWVLCQAFPLALASADIYSFRELPMNLIGLAIVGWMWVVLIIYYWPAK